LFDLLAAAIIALAHPQAPATDTTAVCAFEDGNTDGAPCWWTDPNTGTAYWVDSSNYR
jgi:hypothetical protein